MELATIDRSSAPMILNMDVAFQGIKGINPCDGGGEAASGRRNRNDGWRLPLTVPLVAVVVVVGGIGGVGGGGT